MRFEFNILQRFRDPLTRQAEEGLRIAHNPEDVKLLNSKKEFYHPPIARIKIDKWNLINPMGYTYIVYKYSNIFVMF